MAEETVIGAVCNPEKVERSRNNRFVAERAIDEEHLIRVIYEIRGDEMAIITFYPARKSRYEDKI